MGEAEAKKKRSQTEQGEPECPDWASSIIKIDRMNYYHCCILVPDFLRFMFSGSFASPASLASPASIASPASLHDLRRAKKRERERLRQANKRLSRKMQLHPTADEGKLNP